MKNSLLLRHFLRNENTDVYDTKKCYLVLLANKSFSNFALPRKITIIKKLKPDLSILIEKDKNKAKCIAKSAIKSESKGYKEQMLPSGKVVKNN